MDIIYAIQNFTRVPAMILIALALGYVLYRWNKEGSDGMPGRW